MGELTVLTPRRAAMRAGAVSAERSLAVSVRASTPANVPSPGRSWGRRLPPVVVWPLALLSVAAGAIHAAVVPEHIEEWPAAGSFFILTTAGQLIWALLLVDRPTAARVAAGAAGNGIIVAIWIASRTSGLPFGPEPWMAEPFGVLDSVASTLEFVIVTTILGLSGGAAVRVADGTGRPEE